jgi:Mrp family chromosome partitioning ATPase
MSVVDQAFIRAFASAPPEAAKSAKAEAAGPRPAPQSTLLAHELVGAAPEGLDAPEPPSPAPIFLPAAKADDAFRALLEIDHVAWPAACGELLAHASREWDRFTEQLIERMSEGQKCIALAGTAHGDGSTTISLALARHVAARGLRPLVVDSDPENPELARACGVAVETGWDDVVASGLAAGEALITAVEDGVTLLPLRAAGREMGKLAATARVGEVFGTLREHYDLLVLDATPLVARATIAEFAALASAVRLDAVYLIHNLRTTSREQLSALCSKIRASGLPLVAVIENFIPPAAAPRSSGFQVATG